MILCPKESEVQGKRVRNWKRAKENFWSVLELKSEGGGWRRRSGSASRKDYNYFYWQNLTLCMLWAFFFPPMNISPINIWLYHNLWNLCAQLMTLIQMSTLLFYYLLQTNSAKRAAETSLGQMALRSVSLVFSNVVCKAKQIRTTGRGHRVQPGQLQRVEEAFPEGGCGCVMDVCWTSWS